jgi:AMP nucleosidase
MFGKSLRFGGQQGGIRRLNRPHATRLERFVPAAYCHRSLQGRGFRVSRLEEGYERNTRFLRDRFEGFVSAEPFTKRVRATYPLVRIRAPTHARLDSRLSYGLVAGPGVYETTVTRLDLFPGTSVNRLDY